MFINDKIIAKSLSVLFHPLIYPTFSFLLLFFYDSFFIVRLTQAAKIYILSVVILNTLVLPFVLLWLLKKRGFIRSFQLEDKKERFYPLIMYLLFNVMTWYLIYKLSLPPIYTYIIALSTSLTAVAFFLNIFIKISLHSLGASALAASILGINHLYHFNMTFGLIVVFMIVGLIASSGLVIKAHNPLQVYSSLILGFLIGTSSVYFFL